MAAYLEQTLWLSPFRTPEHSRYSVNVVHDEPLRSCVDMYDPLWPGGVVLTSPGSQGSHVPWGTVVADTKGREGSSNQAGWKNPQNLGEASDRQIPFCHLVSL